MKSYFLAPVASRSAAVAALTLILPGQVETWLLKNNDDDAIAYFSLIGADSTTGVRTIQVDVSGRHYDRDEDVVSVLEKIRKMIGGEITSAP